MMIIMVMMMIDPQRNGTQVRRYCKYINVFQYFFKKYIISSNKEEGRSKINSTYQHFTTRSTETKEKNTQNAKAT